MTDDKKHLYVVHFGDDEPEFYDDIEDAIAAADQAVKELFDPATLQYEDGVDKIFVAKIVAVALEHDRVDRPPKEELDADGFDKSGLDWSDGHEYICDYRVARLPEAVEPDNASARVIH